MNVSVFDSADAPESLLKRVHELCLRAFDGDFELEDWEHALGGRHFMVIDDVEPIAHASVVERLLWVDDHPYRAGYVEAVATEPSLQGRGYGTAVMRAAGEWIRVSFELGCLGTGEHHFYERLGWVRWRGSSAVRYPDGSLVETPEDSDGIMILRTDATRDLDLTGRIECSPRSGDDW